MTPGDVVILFAFSMLSLIFMSSLGGGISWSVMEVFRRKVYGWVPPGLVAFALALWFLFYASDKFVNQLGSKNILVYPATILAGLLAGVGGAGFAMQKYLARKPLK